jgi:hypothetical protein
MRWLRPFLLARSCHDLQEGMPPAAPPQRRGSGVAPSLRPGDIPLSRLRRTFNLLRSGKQRGGSSSRRRATSGLRGNVGIHRFWRRGAAAILDVCVTDTDAPYYRGQDPHKILAKHEKEKKDKYVGACLAWHHTFTPLVFSVDGLRGTG